MFLDNFWLGVQTNDDEKLVYMEAYWKCLVWMPKNAKSFTFRAQNTDYYGNPRDFVTGYARINVSYYSDKSGENQAVKEEIKDQLQKFNNDYCFQLVRINEYQPNQRFVEPPNTRNIQAEFEAIIK